MFPQQGVIPSMVFNRHYTCVLCNACVGSYEDWGKMHGVYNTKFALILLV
jgi:hypothetical protein